MLRFPSPESIRAFGQDKTSRSLLIKSTKSEVIVHIPSELWVTAERIRDDFRQGLSIEPPVQEQWNDFELLIIFTRHAIRYAPYHDDEFPVRLFLKHLYLVIHVKYLECKEPHAVMDALLITVELKDALRTYYDLYCLLADSGILKDVAPHKDSAFYQMVTLGTIKAAALFGGQGNTEQLLEELAELNDTYHALCHSFIRQVSSPLLEIDKDPAATEYLSKGFNVLKWLEDSENRPPNEYLFSAAISLPLVGLIQLTNYYLTCRILKITPGEMAKSLIGTTGHSQGIVAACVIAKSKSFEELISNSEQAMKLLFWIGLRSMQVYPSFTVDPKIIDDCIENSEGQPSPMLAITNLTQKEVQSKVDLTNDFLPEFEKIHLALRNGPRSIVCSGPPKSLYGLTLMLRKVKAPPALDQNRIPFNERKMRFSTKFLPISSPFHCQILADAIPLILADIKNHNIVLSKTAFQTKVVTPDRGRPVDDDKNLLEGLVKQICTLSVDWPAALKLLPATHFIDFGPGKASGIGALTFKNLDGTGIQILLAGTNNSLSEHLLPKHSLFSSEKSSVSFGVNWIESYGPRLVANQVDNKIYIDTTFSRLLGRQPVMVAGMTPSTTNGEFVAACLNAGYHVELAGGGLFSESLVRDRIDFIIENTTPGTGITINSLFINQRLWAFQFPLVQTLRQEGKPIEGFTVAAGVPSLEVANEIISLLKSSGIRHISFKPGSLEGILQVVKIAKNNPDMPMLLQWTGGRAGGHHSYEDFHQPILETYSSIRSCSNICLIAGSGFGDGASTLPYLDGSWSVAFEYPPMPFDGFLFGSRMMVAKECRTSHSVKKAIVEATGVEVEADWVKSYEKPAGGVVTVVSELGEPIHKIATRGVLLWKEFDETVFKLPKDKRAAYLNARKKEIISKLNNDGHKVWFGEKESNQACDLPEMSYKEILFRLAKLLYIRDANRWIDMSYRHLFFDFLARTEERLCRTQGTSCLPSVKDMEENPKVSPYSFLDLLSVEGSLNWNQLVSSEDCLYFLSLCRRTDRKPVPFIPVLDADFESWFKRDSLWQSEDIEAVVDCDPQRVCILQGPVAAKYSHKVDQPVKTILDEIVECQVKHLRETLYHNDTRKIPTIECFGFPFSTATELDVPMAFEQHNNYTQISSASTNSAMLPVHTEQWLQFLIGGGFDWLTVVLGASTVVRGKSLAPNNVGRLFKFQAGYGYKIKKGKTGREEILVEDSTGRELLRARCVDGRNIVINIFNYIFNQTSQLELHYRVDLHVPKNPLTELMESRNLRIKEFYWKTWFGDKDQSFGTVYDLDPLEMSFRSQSKASKSEVDKFCRVVGNKNVKYSGSNARIIPLDYLIVLAWKDVIKCLFPKKVDGDLIGLVHLSNQITLLSERQFLQDFDVNIETRIASILWNPSGKIVETFSLVSIAGEQFAKIASRFMFRGNFDKNDFYFSRVQGLVKDSSISSHEELAVLRSKQWINWKTDHISTMLQVNSLVRFELDYVHVLDVANEAIDKIVLGGRLSLKSEAKVYETIANISFSTSGEKLTANPVLQFVERMSNHNTVVNSFENDQNQGLGEEIALPTRESNFSYAQASGDLNPIHTNSLIAEIAGLPGTITHGMWTSAAVRSIIETHIADGFPMRIRDYHVSFEDMVLPGQELRVKLSHVGMKSGYRIIKIEVFSGEGGGTRVLSGFADVDQPKTAFVFTGQGSQEVGMGMDLYNSSTVAKQVWDTADQHFFKKYGFSILDIVCRNPKELTVYFGGPRGWSIRKTYMEMDYEGIDSDGLVKKLKLFPQITENSRSYTFSSPNGLLFATQFTQPALTLLEKAQFEDMRAKGLISSSSLFAGHSLGEYAALAAVGDVLSIENLCDVVFYRGLAMQVVVPRDKRGRSEYGMVAVNPARIGLTNDAYIRKLVRIVADETKLLLEIVNFNVENWQYVVAGHNFALYTVSELLNHLGRNRGTLDIKEDSIIEAIKTTIRGIISMNGKDGKFESSLQKGIATIPLVGIDVPFHSSFLLGGVSAFRKCLENKIMETSIDPLALEGKYIPNLIGRPFEISRSFIQRVLDRCDSVTLSRLIKNWSEEDLKIPEKLQTIARTLIIELLAYQFASPVQWIETQDVFFRDHQIERMIELGPSPILTNMAERTIQLKYQAYDDALNQRRKFWSYVRNRDEIYYEQSQNSVSQSVNDIREVSSTVVVSKPSPPVQQLRKPASRIEELPLEAEEFLRILVSLKTKKPISEITPTKTIKELSGGKSTLQNEILADLQKEFGDAIPERSEELMLKDLATQIKGKFVKKPGKYSSQLISKMLSSKMPAGFSLSTIKEFLEREMGIVGAAVEQLLMFGLASEPPSRFSNEEGAKEWLGTLASRFFDEHSMARPMQEDSGERSIQISSAELEKLQSNHKKLIRQQIELFATYLEQNLLEFQNVADEKGVHLANLQADIDLFVAELSQQFLEGIKPLFSTLKVRTYDSYWNWSRQDVYILYHELLFGRLVNVDRDVTAKCLHVMNRASPELLKFMEYHIFSSPEMQGNHPVESAHHLTRKYGEMLIQQVREFMDKKPVYKDVSMHTRPQVSISFEGNIEYNEVRRSGVSSFEAYVREMRQAYTSGKPWLFIRDRSIEDHNRWELCASKSEAYLSTLADMAANGVSFEDKVALVTGCGRGSIGCEVVKGLLSGGAKVIVTTSSFNRSTVDYFRSIYECHGARSSCLIVAPFNQASTQDVSSLVNYIYDNEKGLGWDLDYIVPFAAISENGRMAYEIDGKSELAHRIMLTNVLRLLGQVVVYKKNKRIESRPAEVILPLSPNHGNFGGDGLYGESKLGLEVLFNKWHAEDWSSYLSVAGAVIGWTRGTGLMNDNNLLAEAMERKGVRTFSPNEMAFNILGLMHPKLMAMAEENPLYGDLNGGLDRITNLAEMTRNLREEITKGAQVRRALAKERALEALLELDKVQPVQNISQRANLTFAYPLLEEFAKLPQKRALNGLLDLSKVVVVTGFSEVGPWGNSRTRWEMEAEGEFSLEGCIEMAWMMGLIRYNSSNMASNGKSYSGWVDAKTGEPVNDLEVKSRYEREILSHSGIRLVEPDLFDGYDPNRKSLCQEVVIDYDLPPISVSTKEEADQFKLRHGSYAEAYEQVDGTWTMRLRRGATIYIPKALRFDRLVAGQIPTGWKAERYGVPSDIVNQLDPVSLYVLVATVEALVSAGITDPYEFYRYVHVSEVGNTSGGGEGGMMANKKIFLHRFLDKPVPADILQESFINTMPAWINLLILSSSGPIKTPVGACATAVESVEIGLETILSERARVVIVGGYDDFQEESSYEFAQMKATSSATEELSRGRQPNEMSRPTATSRAGFMEAQGAGIQILMTAELALEMGCPIYGIVAGTSTATDKAGRSIPAPGQGIITTARSVRSPAGGPLPRTLDLNYRRRQLDKELHNIRRWHEEELEELAQYDFGNVKEVECRAKDLELELQRKEKMARQLWGHEFWKSDSRIAPLEGALAVFGLTIDDIGVASFHGTGTKANDPNEAQVVNRQLEHLGRTPGNLLPCVFQKYLTGHPKGAAAAWMLNGALQILDTGIIPGNRNADNIDKQLQECNHLLFLSRSIQTTGVRAALLKSFGFGQVGGEVLLVHPNYLFAALTAERYDAYKTRRMGRHNQTYRYLHDMLVGTAPLVQVKDHPPYTPQLESRVYLNPLARASFDSHTGSYSFKEGEIKTAEKAALTSKLAMDGLLLRTGQDEKVEGVGVDVQLITDLPLEESFLQRNFTEEEVQYCRTRADQQASLAGRWAAKEAIVKALCAAHNGVRPSWLTGPGGPLKDIEVMPDPIVGFPRVRIGGQEKEDIRISISHSGSYAVAIAVISS